MTKAVESKLDAAGVAAANKFYDVKQAIAQKITDASEIVEAFALFLPNELDPWDKFDLDEGSPGPREFARTKAGDLILVDDLSKNVRANLTIKDEPSDYMTAEQREAYDVKAKADGRMTMAEVEAYEEAAMFRGELLTVDDVKDLFCAWPDCTDPYQVRDPADDMQNGRAWYVVTKDDQLIWCHHIPELVNEQIKKLARTGAFDGTPVIQNPTDWARRAKP